MQFEGKNKTARTRSMG